MTVNSIEHQMTEICCFIDDYLKPRQRYTKTAARCSPKMVGIMKKIMIGSITLSAITSLVKIPMLPKGVERQLKPDAPIDPGWVKIPT